MSESRSDVSEGCQWCGGNGRLETYTASGEVDEWTQCVCILNFELAAALKLVPDGEAIEAR